MTTLTKSILAIAIVVLAGLAAAVWGRAGLAPRGTIAESGDPVAQVGTALATERTMIESLDAFGEVTNGQLVGVSFARAGQLTQLRAVPGDRVAKGTLLAELSVDPAAREGYLQASNALSLARQEASRLHQLLDLQLATRSQVDAADKALQDAAGSLRALDALGGSSATTTVKAPFDGVVASVAVAQGDRVQAGAPVLQLAHADALRVQIGIEPAQSHRVRPGTKVRLAPIASTSGSPMVIDAVVSSVQDLVDPKTQLVSAIVTLPRAASAQLVPGMKVRATVQVGTHTALAVVRNAVLTDAKGDYVYQVSKGSAHRVAVKKLLESAGYVAIAGITDLSAPVVTTGNYELQDGMAVKVSAP